MELNLKNNKNLKNKQKKAQKVGSHLTASVFFTKQFKAFHLESPFF